MTPKQLKTARKRLKLSQEALGANVGRTGRQVSNWETGHTPIPHWLPVLIQAIKGE